MVEPHSRRYWSVMFNAGYSKPSLARALAVVKERMAHMLIPGPVEYELLRTDEAGGYTLIGEVRVAPVGASI